MLYKGRNRISIVLALGCGRAKTIRIFTPLPIKINQTHVPVCLMIPSSFCITLFLWVNGWVWKNLPIIAMLLMSVHMF